MPFTKNVKIICDEMKEELIDGIYKHSYNRGMFSSFAAFEKLGIRIKPMRMRDQTR